MLKHNANGFVLASSFAISRATCVSPPFSAVFTNFSSSFEKSMSFIEKSRKLGFAFIAEATHAAPNGIACGEVSTRTVVQIMFFDSIFSYHTHCIRFPYNTKVNTGVESESFRQRNNVIPNLFRNLGIRTIRLTKDADLRQHDTEKEKKSFRTCFGISRVDPETSSG